MNSPSSSINKPVVLFGTGKIAEVIDFYLQQNGYEVQAFCNEDAFIETPIFQDRPVVPLSKLKEKYPPTTHQLFTALGYKQHNDIRAKRAQELKNMGYSLLTFVDPQATYYEMALGENTFIFENNVIQPYTTIGNNVIVWSGNHIGHHSHIQDNTFISSQVVISGNCVIENNCFLGVNSTVADGVTIGAHSAVGAGAVVTKSIPPRSLVVPERSKVIPLKRDIL